jgi:nucleotide-binding universal stress UspA family protein
LARELRFSRCSQQTYGAAVTFAHILIATDGSELSERAVAQGLALAKVHAAKVTAVHVTEPWTAAVAGEWALAFPEEKYEETAAASQKPFSRASKQNLGVSAYPARPIYIKDQYAAEGIVEAANTRNCDLIVMASHGRRGFARFLMGSQALRVLMHSSVPVLVYR